jgi:hypothetical protein
VARKRNDPAGVSYTRRILIQLVIWLALGLFVVVWQRDFLADVYIRNQLTHVGWFINGGIFLLFAAGMMRLVLLFIHYNQEEQMLNRFLANIRQKIEPVQGVDAGSLVAKRYRTLLDLHNRRSHINHNALASTLLADETSLISFPKFVHNVLILTGVFGTIVSLSIALLGASDMIQATTEIGSLGRVIHGMSTALSTTMTAILAYLFFGYFYLRLTDTQTHVISRLEDVTATVLLPRFQIQPETVIQDFSDIIRAAAALVKRLDASQAQYAQTASQLNDVLGEYRAEMQRNSDVLADIAQLLRQGFRLSGEDRR